MVGTLGVAQVPLTEPQVGSLLPQLLTFPVAETEVHIPPPTGSPCQSGEPIYLAFKTSGYCSSVPSMLD